MGLVTRGSEGVTVVTATTSGLRVEGQEPDARFGGVPRWIV